jgi:hypothetical protein
MAIGISLADDIPGSEAIGCSRPTQAGLGWLRGIPAAGSSEDSGAVAGATSIVDLAATTTGIKDVVKVSGIATTVLRNADLDPAVAIMEASSETADIAKAATKHLI